MKELKKIRINLIGQWLYSVPNFSKLLKIGWRKFLYFLFPYLKYEKEKKENTFWNYCYHNFRNNIKWWEFWLENFIEYNWLNKNNKKIDFFSVFWPKKNLKYSKNVKIFYTWEYIGKDRFPSYDDYCLWQVDFSIWFREYDIKNYYRLPLRLTTLIEPKETPFEQIKEKIEKLESYKTKFKKDKFACLIASHNDKNEIRTNTYNKLISIWNIDCPWLLLHNIDIKIPKYEDKINFMKDYKFNICPENKYYKWYVTEKFIDTIKAWCIPIYYGCFNDFDEKIFNKDRILFCDDKNLKDKVEILNFNEKNYLEFIEQPIFSKWASETIYKHIKIFEKKLKKVF